MRRVGEEIQKKKDQSGEKRTQKMKRETETKGLG